ncbi:MAG: hypothetical protein KY451_08215 [Actinobacteria bacterium]|nr:hypothetical protein [Actinomycetota bacterium]MBW3646911.1 hypothetical protein [Actinomycetota bacterium]
MEQDRLSTEDVARHDGEQRQSGFGDDRPQERDPATLIFGDAEGDGRDDDRRTEADSGDRVPDDDVAYGTAPTGTEASAPEDQPAPLLSDSEADVYLDRWREVQARFIDDPRAAVQDGDGLVTELMRSLTNRFGEQKSALEERWNSGGQPETEQLRRALQDYRSFFERLLST